MCENNKYLSEKIHSSIIFLRERRLFILMKETFTSDVIMLFLFFLYTRI